MLFVAAAAVENGLQRNGLLATATVPTNFYTAKIFINFQRKKKQILQSPLKFTTNKIYILHFVLPIHQSWIFDNLISCMNILNWRKSPSWIEKTKSIQCTQMMNSKSEKWTRKKKREKKTKVVRGIKRKHFISIQTISNSTECSTSQQQNRMENESKRGN